METRERAQALIMGGLVYSAARRVPKPGTPVAADAVLEVKGRLRYVSRGGIKLEHALDQFGLDVSGSVVLDVGASTGGFTDCVLQRGATTVYAVDVGHGQLDYGLRRDPRVRVLEGVNARYPFSLPQHIPTPMMGEAEGEIPPTSNALPLGEGKQMVDLATVDVAFISVTMVLRAVAEHLKGGGPIVVLVKPQFEARREEVGRGGVIRDPARHAAVLGRVILWVVQAGFRLRNLVPSPILGDAGNREFFMRLQKGA